jgi:hypothetical protein
MAKVKMKWVDTEEILKIKSGRKVRYEVTQFMEELYANPNAWAEYPVKVNSHAWAYRISERFAQIEVAQTGGNNLSVTHPDKKLWTVYMRYNPDLPKEKK